MPQPCGVCGDTRGITKCYGGQVCGSCRIFFLRAVVNSENYVCQKERNCVIVSEKWAKNCRACRFSRCLAAQMDPASVGNVKRAKKLRLQQGVTPVQTPFVTKIPKEEVASPPLTQIEHSPRTPDLLPINEQDQPSPRPLSTCPTPEDLPEVATTPYDPLLPISTTNALTQATTSSAIFVLNQMLQNTQQLCEMTATPLSLPSTSSFHNLLFNDLPELSAQKLNLLRLHPPLLHLDLTRTTELLGNTYALGLSFVDSLKKNLGSAKSYASSLYALETTSFAQSSWITPTENPILAELQSARRFDLSSKPSTSTVRDAQSPVALIATAPSTSAASPPSLADPTLSPELGLSFINLDVTLRNALLDPLLLCQRVPMNWDSLQAAPDMHSAFRFLYCRQTVHYIDWLSSLGDIHLLEQRDRLMLISAGLSHVQLLMMFYHTYRTGSNGIAYSLGYHYLIKGGGTEFENFLDALARYGQEMVVAEFRRLSIKPEEYILLKTITLYSCSMRLTDVGMEVVRRARQKHEQILVEYMKEEYPTWTDEERSVRVHNILAIKNYLRNMALMDNSYIGRMVALNISSMQCQLAYDVHLKEF